MLRPNRVWLVNVSEGGLEPPRPCRALAPQASASAIPPLGLCGAHSVADVFQRAFRGAGMVGSPT